MEVDSSGRAQGAAGLRVRLAGRAQLQPAAAAAWQDLPALSAALLLLVAVEGSVSRERVAGMLWPSAGPVQARNSLRDRVRQLRRQAGAEPFADGEALALAGGVQHDLALLHGAALTALDEAPPAELLAGLELDHLGPFAEWLALARSRWAAARRHALLALLQQQERARRFDAAVAVAERLVADEPAQESGWRELMRLLHQQGQTAAARRVLRRCREVLREQLDADLSPATRRLATLIEMGSSLPAAEVPVVAAPRPQTPVVGREGELQRLVQTLQAGRSVWLQGEAGIGKSRLIEALVAAMPQAFAVAALQGDAQIPFSTLERMLRGLWARCRPPLSAAVRAELARLVPEFGQASPRPARRARLVRALGEALAAWAQAGVGVWLLDDRSWADEASAQLLAAALAATAAAARPVCLIASRSGPAAAAHDPLADWAQGDHWLQLALPPLDLPAVLAWLQAQRLPLIDAAAWAHALLAQTAGNPLLLQETLHALRQQAGDGVLAGPPPAAQAWPVSQELQGLLQARLARLDPQQRRLAQMAALAGTWFNATVAARLAEVPEIDLADDWAALQDARVLQGSRLAHDTLREPLLQSLPAPVAEAMHRRLAELGPSFGAAAADVARHAALGHAWAQAAPAYEQAAADAARLNARHEQAQALDLAAEAHERCGQAGAAWRCRLEAWGAAVESSPASAMEQRLLQLEREAAGQGEGSEAPLDLALARARLATTMYRFGQALAVADAALPACHALAARGPAQRQRWLRLACMRASALAGLGRAADALAAVDDLQAALQPADDLRLRMDVAGTRGYALGVLHRAAESIQAYESAIALATELDDGAELLTMTVNLGGLVANTGNFRRARELLLDAHRWRDEQGGFEGIPLSNLLQNQGLVALRLGRYREAIEHLGRVAALSRESDAAHLRASAESYLALAYVELGDADRAEACLGPLPEASQSGLRLALPRAVCEAAIARLRGQPALPLLERAQALVPQAALTPTLMWTLAASEHLPPDQALRRCAEAADRARAAGLEGFVQAAWMQQADALQRAGEPAAAWQMLQQVLARWQDCWPSHLYAARVWWQAAVCCEALGLHAERERMLQQGRQWVQATARHQVPHAHRRSFCERNPVNAALLAA